MKKARENNYDLLRICSAFAVVVLHISGGFLRVDSAKVPTNCDFPLMLLNNITRFAVPCFFMLSGAFILDDERNADYKYFYKKSLKNIGITGIVFCVLYVLYDIGKLVIRTFILHIYGAEVFSRKLFSIFLNVLKGNPYGHLWYLFTLIGLYIVTPFVIRLAAELCRGGGGGMFVWQGHNSFPCFVEHKLHNK